jgi:hypothetical protein
MLELMMLIRFIRRRRSFLPIKNIRCQIQLTGQHQRIDINGSISTDQLSTVQRLRIVSGSTSVGQYVNGSALADKCQLIIISERISVDQFYMSTHQITSYLPISRPILHLAYQLIPLIQLFNGKKYQRQRINIFRINLTHTTVSS